MASTRQLQAEIARLKAGKAKREEELNQYQKY
jgi:uncharacterized small protein (DUF1192 family)